MKRRDMIRLAPLAAAGMAGAAAAQDLRFMYPNVDAYRREGGFDGPIAVEYTRRVRDMLLWIRETQSENILEAAYAVARTVMDGGSCWYMWDMGHSITVDLVPERNGVPEIFTIGYDAKRTKPGDLFLDNILGTPEVLADIGRKNIFVVGAPAPWGSDARNAHLIERDSARHRIRPVSRIWIETNIDTIGAIMRIPGMPAPIGPVSGVIGQVVYWMMMADACRVLAREGHPVPVRGDEPSPPPDTALVANLYDPLMDDYLEQVMLQIEMVEAELGDLRRMAAMAVDSALDGGTVWVYSRTKDGLCVEGYYRRGGLTLTQGIYWDDAKDGIRFYSGDPIEPTGKDTVIMGLTEPDHPTDLRALDWFRSHGMKVASLGPMTRDMKVPEGRTVPKEADIHAGRMCDTYGLYALPGFERRICPTSGPVMNQLFWAACMEMVGEVRRRSGNLPGILFSAAVRGGSPHDVRLFEVYRNRGY